MYFGTMLQPDLVSIEGAVQPLDFRSEFLQFVQQHFS